MKKNIFIKKIHTYDFEIDGETFILSFADSDRWNSGTRGTKVISIEDTGNDLIIRYHDGNSPRKSMEYDTAHALNILLSLMHEEQGFDDFVSIDDETL